MPDSAKKKKKKKKQVWSCGGKHIHLFRRSLAGTHLFVTENTASEGVIEWPAVSDPVQGLHRIETVTTKLGLRWKRGERGLMLLLSSLQSLHTTEYLALLKMASIQFTVH